MTKVLITDTTMTSIANSIRAKLGTSATMLPSEMPGNIDTIPTGDEYLKKFEDLGYTKMPVPYEDEDFEYAEDILENWDSSTTSMNKMFKEDLNLKIFPEVDTSNVTDVFEAFYNSNLICLPKLDLTSVTTNAREMCTSCTYLTFVEGLEFSGSPDLSTIFADCRSLNYVGVINFNNGTPNMENMFLYDYTLTDESLNNILLSCITTSGLPSNKKKLSYLWYNDGNFRTIYKISRIQTLPAYQDFLSAGWTYN